METAVLLQVERQFFYACIVVEKEWMWWRMLSEVLVTRIVFCPTSSYVQLAPSILQPTWLFVESTTPIKD